MIIVIVKISIPKLIVLKKMFEEGVGTLFGQIVFEGTSFLSGASLIVQAQSNPADLKRGVKQSGSPTHFLHSWQLGKLTREEEERRPRRQ